MASPLISAGASSWCTERPAEFRCTFPYSRYCATLDGQKSGVTQMKLPPPNPGRFRCWWSPRPGRP